MTNKTIIYIRTSTEEQNPENQLKDCLTLVQGEHEVISEQQSAFKDKEREGFNKILKEIKANKIEHLIVWDLDRIYRNRKKLIEFFEVCKIYNCKIHSFGQAWLEDLNKIPAPFDEIVHSLMLQIMGWLAEEESKKKSDRVKIAVRRVEGKPTKSYKGNVWGRKSISKNVIKRVMGLYGEGKSIRAISNEVSYYTSSNNKRFLSKSAVHKIIQDNKGKDDIITPSPLINSLKDKGGKHGTTTKDKTR